jgi:formate hydrogenlyase transcriptional activator
MSDSSGWGGFVPLRSQPVAARDPHRTPSVAICILNSEHRYVSVNDQITSFHGIGPSEHVGKTVREVLGPLAEHIDPHLRNVFDSGRSVLNVELSSQHPTTKKNVHWRMHFFPLRDEAGKISRVCMVLTELAKEDYLERAVRDLDESLRMHHTRLQTLSEINALLSSNWDIARVFGAISAQLRHLLHHEFASILLYEAEGQQFKRHALDFPLGKGLFRDAPVSLKNGPMEPLSQGSSLIFSKTELQAFENAFAQELVAEGVQSICCTPMMRPHGLVGALVLGSTRQRAFSPDHLALITQVARQLALALENHRAVSEIRALKQRLGEERKYLDGEIEHEGHFTEIVGNSPALRQVLHQVTTVSASDATVLIMGETGTGKELIARAIHRLSKRKESPFIKVNCAAIPTGLLESELFGHERGAFTGAISQKVGRMELADGGTLFLDEVGEIPLELQPKLLRVLQDHEFERLGSNRTIKVNLRLVAATNRNLAERIAQNQFRSDLYYRLSVFPIVVPPLRERKNDIPLLVRYLVRQFNLRTGRHIESIPTTTMNALQAWDWPGNIRELENLLERSVILSEGSVLRVPLSELRDQSYPSETDAADKTLDQAERQHILRVLRETKGKLSGPNGAAKRLGLKRTTLQSKMHRLKITRDDYSSPPKH